REGIHTRRPFPETRTVTAQEYGANMTPSTVHRSLFQVPGSKSPHIEGMTRSGARANILHY
ncbi:MAG: hypothetical protein KGJ85_18150, partial [Betaproteobacteria bacterium]|nr:hypothetical protein [Betaproteobacteria bacterium]